MAGNNRAGVVSSITKKERIANSCILSYLESARQALG
jgi:hypothetical protein